MSRFNLIDESWMPVRFSDRSRGELGIRDILLRSKEIAAIEDPSPLVVAGLHRFLLAVLYRALEGPTDIEHAKDLFRAGFPNEKITKYLEARRDRFWLFDATHPFGQNPRLSEESTGPWNRLTAENNPTSNKVLFDHTDMRNAGERQPSMCARWLISTMNFSIAGGRGYYPSPSSNAMMCIPCGQDLFQTLCYCLVPYPNRDVMSRDAALWEREPHTLPLENPKRSSTGYADLFTWQSRMILLERSPSGNVSLARFAAGEGFDNTSKEPDPMQSYRIDKDRGRLPLQFREDRGTWRDFDSLLPDPDGHAPLTIQNAIRLSGGKTANLPKSVLVLGLRYDPPNANLDFWRMERFVLPEALAGDRSVRTEIRQLLTDAEEVEESLWRACRSYARDLLSRGSRKPTGKDINGFVEQMLVIPLYWSTLESRFHEVLREYFLDLDAEDLRCQWLKSVRHTLRVAWEQHRASVSTGDAWAIRAIVRAEGPVVHTLNELDDEIQKLEPHKEDA